MSIYIYIYIHFFFPVDDKTSAYNLNCSGEIKLQEWSLLFNVVNVDSSLPEIL